MSKVYYEVVDFNNLTMSTHLALDSAVHAWSTANKAKDIKAVWGSPYSHRNFTMSSIYDTKTYEKLLKEWTDEDLANSYWDSQLVKEKTIKEHVDPKHYQGYIELENETLQWLEAMQYLPNLRDPACFKAAVELQARKYLDRLGGKDFEVQELLKGIWYLRFLAAYVANGNKPIRVKDIDKLLG